MPATDRDFDHFFAAYQIAQQALSMLRGGPLGPPGIKGLQYDLWSVCSDVIEEAEERGLVEDGFCKNEHYFKRGGSYDKT